MPSSSPDSAVSLPMPGFWQQLTDGGPLYLLFHFLFVVSVLLAVIVVLRRCAFPWMLFVSSMPFIWAAAAAHLGFISHLIAMTDSSAELADRIAPFYYATRAFNWGCVISGAFIAMSIFLRPKNEKAPNTNA